ncbi:MAG: ABC transporter ATP-binding protein [Verrucomicrobia bacterium]|nr:ABC transporter ATP-binding protein [Verrucomicrobiota bacterium]
MATQTTSRGSVYRRTLRYYAPHRGEILLALIFVLLTIGVNLLKPWPLKYIVDVVLSDSSSALSNAARAHPTIDNLDDLLGGNPVESLSKRPPMLGENPSEWQIERPRIWNLIPAERSMRCLALLCGALVIIHLLWGAFNLVNNYLQVKIGLQALARVRCDLFGHLQRLSLRFHDARNSADSMYRVSYDAQAIQTIFNRGFSSVFGAVITLIGTAGIMVRMDWGLTLLALGIAPALFYAIYFFADRIRRESTTISESESALTSRTQEGLTGIRIVHAFGREDYEMNRFQEQCLKSLRANLRLTFTHITSALVVGTLMGAGTAAMIYFGARHVLQGTLSVGDLLVFLSYLGMLYEPLQTLSYTSWALEGAAAGAQRVFEILDTPEDVRDRPDARPVSGVKGKIEFERVSFGYEKTRLILKGVEARIEPGQTAAFVGATGAGKTTLLSLIPRFYDPVSGAIKLDGADLRALRKKTLRAQIGMVLQDTMLLAGTIRENIGYGRLDAGAAEIEAAARAARAHDFAVQLPKGYDTEVGERGVRLSVGQRQRIGIARAFLKNAPILLLDEPTSALDPETEEGIMETLKELMRGRTTVIVTHRIATVHGSDWIFVMENGCVIEGGRGPDLLKQGGVYARLYQAQTRAQAGDR